MKYKTIVLALILLIIACGAQSAFAEDATAGNFTMTVPDGFSVQQNTSSLIGIGDDDHTAYILIGFNVSQKVSEIRSTIEEEGATFLNQTNYTYAGYNITQFDFEDVDGYNQYVYYCQKGNDTIGINTLTKNEYPAIGDDANPATSILSSIKS